METARVSESWDLPDELWPEILSRLPAKSILRFRCVSRSWKTWIDDPNFTRLHLNRLNSRGGDPQIVLVRAPYSECVVKNSETLETISSLGFIQSKRQSDHVVRSTPARNPLGCRLWGILSSIDGLFLIKWKDDLMLWNPAIRKTLPLPPLRVTAFLNSGLGFDPLSRDYKVVNFGSRLSREPFAAEPFAAVYTLTTKEWRVIDYHLRFYDMSPSIYFSGVLYHIARDNLTDNSYNTYKLVTFDMSTEVFDFFELPVTHTKGSMYYLATFHDDCSLALVHLGEYEKSMWILERLGDDTNTVSWIQRYTSSTACQYEFCDCKVLWIKKNGDMLMQRYDKLICYNLETQEVKIVMENEENCFRVMHQTATYVESLILHSY